MARFDGKQLTLEFEITDQATHHPWLWDFKPGLREVAIPLEKIASVRFTIRWYRHTLEIQTHSVRLAANVPFSDNANITLRIDGPDKGAASEVADQITRRLQPPATATPQPAHPAGAPDVVPAHLVSEPKPSPHPRSGKRSSTSAARSEFHPGKLAKGIVMMLLGGTLLMMGTFGRRAELLWVGIGILIGGAGVAGGAFKFQVRLDKSLGGPNPGKLVMGVVMVALGTVCLLLGFLGREALFMWTGFGIILGGGGCFSGAWIAKSTPVRFPTSESAPSKAIMGAVMLTLGLFLFAMGWLSHGGGSAFTWVGFGIVLGGGGCLSGIWKEAEG